MARTRHAETIDLGATIPGTRHTLRILRYGTPGARPKAYLQAAIHACEMTGTLAMLELADLLDAAAARGEILGEIVLLPMCNPIGYGQFLLGEQSGRFDLRTRDNYNRGHFEISEAVAEAVAGRLGADAAANVAAIRDAAREVVGSIPKISEIVAWRTALLGLAIDADLVFDIHSDLDAVAFMYVNRADWPGAGDIAASLGCLATILNEPYAATTNFSGVVGSLWPRLAERFGPATPIANACTAVLLELRGRHSVSHELARDDARRFYAMLQRRGLVAGDPGPLPDMPPQGTPISGMDVGYAPFAGPAVYHVRPGARVAEGDAICDVVDVMQDDPALRRVTLRARSAGTLYARPEDGMVVYPGQVMFRIAGPAPLAHRMGRSWLDD
jgi:predicted deacylase